ncbi:MAG: hypothetical protein ACSLFQ_05710 [Thermoanaerobaculia bacterium]
MALLLKKIGIENVRPLEGGLDSWRKQGKSTESRRIVVPPTVDEVP